MAPNSVRSVDVAGKNAITSATRNATTIAELISTVPQTWRTALGAHLTTIYRTASKLCTVQNTIVQYERHVAEGTLPASISNSIKAPRIQFSKEFLGTEIGVLANGAIDSNIRDARKAFLTFALDKKKEELATLQALTRFDLESWLQAITDVAVRVAGTMGGSFHVQKNQSGNAPGWTGAIPAALMEDCQALWEYGAIYHYRTVALARSISDRSLLEKTRALSLKKDADTAMRDADTELTTREVVREEMQAQMRLLETRLTKTISQPRKSAPRRGGSNPSRVTKKAGTSKKGQGKGKGRRN